MFYNLNWGLIFIVVSLVPPSIWAVPAGGHLKVKQGDTVELHCNVSGNPVPRLTWSRHGTALPASAGCNHCLRLANIGPGHSGAYDCAADNGVPPSAAAVVNLHVQCKSCDHSKTMTVHPMYWYCSLEYKPRRYAKRGDASVRGRAAGVKDVGN